MVIARFDCGNSGGLLSLRGGVHPRCVARVFELDSDVNAELHSSSNDWNVSMRYNYFRFCLCHRVKIVIIDSKVFDVSEIYDLLC